MNVTSRKSLWAGRTLSGLAILFLLFDWVIKFFPIPAVTDSFTQLGYLAVTIGVLELVCGAIAAHGCRHPWRRRSPRTGRSARMSGSVCTIPPTCSARRRWREPPLVLWLRRIARGYPWRVSAPLHSP